MENSELKVGFSRVDITPPLGTNLVGYFIQRIADGILDPLEVNAIAIQKKESKVVIVSLDNEGATTDFLEECRGIISKELNIDKRALFIHSTHTHLSPRLGVESELGNDIDKEYAKLTLRKIVDAVRFSFEDLKPAKMGIAFSKAEKIGFNRRYLMKDGSVKTNPGVNNPDIVKAIGLLDETVNVVRFDRENGESIVIANYGNHPDTIGKCKISGDWPALARRTFEKAIENTKCIVLNGAQGDINHVNVSPKGGDLNNMILDFDDVSRGYSHAKHMGNVVAGSIMQVYEKVEYIDVDSVKFLSRVIDIPTNMPLQSQIANAHYIKEMHDTGRESELPFKGMELTTVVAEALRMVRFENGPEFIKMTLTGIAIGDVALIGIPGEPFTGIGLGLKESKDYRMIMPTCLTNASQGYFPMQDSYDEGGYEARSSEFKAGVAELIVKEGLALLSDLKNK